MLKAASLSSTFPSKAPSATASVRPSSSRAFPASSRTHNGRMAQPSEQDLFKWGLAHHQAGKLADAENFYRQLLRRNPKRHDAIHLLGLLAHQVGKHDLAAELIAEAIALEPDAPIYHNNLAEAYRAAGRHALAEPEYRRAIALSADYADAWSNL